MTTRYNIYHNANEAFQTDLKTLEDKFEDNYTHLLPPHPIYELAKDDFTSDIPGFDVTIEKCTKAIQTHSIRSFPRNGKYSLRRVREQAKIEEFNPFIHRVWLLWGEAQFYKGNLLQALSTFNYISRHFRNKPEVVLQARLWMIRTYLVMGWVFDAENLLPLIKGVEVPPFLAPLYNTVWFELLLKKDQYAEALPYLQKAIPLTKSKTQKYRLIYLESQLYALTGNKAKAYESLAHIIRMNPPYSVAVHAKIKQGELSSANQSEKAIRTFKRMLKDPKNENYSDQILLAIGNMHLYRQDTAQALNSYAEAITKSTRNGIEKSLSALQMADIYFTKKLYTEAEPYYAIALSGMNAENKRYKEVQERASILSDFAKYDKQIQLQDSLLVLSTLSEEERNKAIRRVIDEIIRKEEIKAAEELEKEYNSNKNDYESGESGIKPVSPPPGVNNNHFWYFYNPQLVAAGKEIFKKQWGNRKLEDNWRRKEKSGNTDFTSDSDELLFADAPVSPDKGVISNLDDAPEFEESDDPKDLDFYLKQIPFTSDQKQAAHAIIQNGLFHIGGIYKDRLEDYTEAVSTYNKLLADYPQYKDKLKVLYELYLIYCYKQDMTQAEDIRNKVLHEFKDTKIAQIVSDPDYIQDYQKRLKAEEQAYSDAFDVFRKGNLQEVRDRYKLFIDSYPASKLMPKFMFLNAIALLSEGESESFKQELDVLVKEYPKDAVTEIATDIIKGINEGRELNTGGFYPSYDGELADRDPMLTPDSTSRQIEEMVSFEDDPLSPHQIVFMIPEDPLYKNDLIYQIAKFNFSNFVVREYDIETQTSDKSILIIVKGFKSREELFFYENRLRRNSDFMKQLRDGVKLIPISERNLEILLEGGSTEIYLDFYNNLKTQYEKDKNSMGR